MNPTDILARGHATADEALQLFDALDTVSVDFLLGRWKGSGFDTSHPLDGLLELSGWYGKHFLSAEEVHPLLFWNPRRTAIIALNPTFVPTPSGLTAKPAMIRAGRVFAPSVRTDKPMARLRTLEHRGRMSVAMIYDSRPIIDVFRKIDERRVLGVMDQRGMERPYFFQLERDDDTALDLRYAR